MVRYGESIYLKGFSAAPNILEKKGSEINISGDENESDGDGEAKMPGGDAFGSSEEEGNSDDEGEMDPIKSIMTALGN